MTICVIGNATVDLSFAVERLPVPGETLLAGAKRSDAGGKGLNQAVMAARAGAAVRFAAVLGTDPSAAIITDRLRDEDLDPNWLARWPGPTDESFIFVTPAGENSIISTGGAAGSMTPEAGARALDGLGPGDLLLMQGNLPRDTTSACLARARELGLRTLFNPAPLGFDLEDLWPLVDVAIVNEVEGALLGGSALPETAGRRLLTKGAGSVVATLGDAGAILVERNGVSTVPAPLVAAVDATGCGDVVCGVLAAGIAAGGSPVAAMPLAIAAASLACTRYGTSSAFPSRTELAELRRQPGGIQP